MSGVDCLSDFQVCQPFLCFLSKLMTTMMMLIVLLIFFVNIEESVSVHSGSKPVFENFRENRVKDFNARG